MQCCSLSPGCQVCASAHPATSSRSATRVSRAPPRAAGERTTRIVVTASCRATCVDAGVAKMRTARTGVMSTTVAAPTPYGVPCPPADPTYQITALMSAASSVGIDAVEDSTHAVDEARCDPKELVDARHHLCTCVHRHDALSRDERPDRLCPDVSGTRTFLRFEPYCESSRTKRSRERPAGARSRLRRRRI